MKSPKYHIGQQIVYEQELEAGETAVVVGKIVEIHFDPVLNEWVYGTSYTRPLPEGYWRLQDVTEEYVKYQLASEGKWAAAATLRVRSA